VTPLEIDPGTVRLVAQRLNQYATPGPNVFVIAVEKHKKNIAKCKPAQPVVRAQHGARDSFTFPAEVFEMSKYLLNLFMSKPRWNPEGILKTQELFIYGDLCYTSNSFCKIC